MKYEYFPMPKNNKTKKMATSFFFGGLILFVLGGLKMIPFRSVLQLAAVASFVVSIMLVGRFLLRYYAYRIEDMGEGDEFFVDEITRRTRFSVCRLEMAKLIGVRKLADGPKDEKNKRRYNYCADAFTKDAYMLEFIDSKYDTAADNIRVIIQPDDKLLEIFEAAVKANAEANSEADYEDK